MSIFEGSFAAVSKPIFVNSYKFILVSHVQDFSSSTRFAHICTALTLEIQQHAPKLATSLDIFAFLCDFSAQTRSRTDFDENIWQFHAILRISMYTKLGCAFFLEKYFSNYYFSKKKYYQGNLLYSFFDRTSDFEPSTQKRRSSTCAALLRRCKCPPSVDPSHDAGAEHRGDRLAARGAAGVLSRDQAHGSSKYGSA